MLTMFYKTFLLMFIALWHQIQCGNFDNDFYVDIPSYDEYSDWEPLPAFVFENKPAEKITEDLSDVTVVTEEKLENPEENKIENVFHILEEIKERIDVINEPLNAIKEHLNERNEPIKVKKEPLEDIILPEAVKETMEDVVILEVINEPLDEDGKDILERDCLKDDEPDKEVRFAGPVKAKGTVSVGTHFGFDSSYPISYPYYPPFFYGPFYYPPYYFPYSPPYSNPHDIYVDILKSYLGIPSKDPHHPNPDLPDCNPEESEVASYWSTSGNNEPKSGIPFGGFVPANGRISIAAHF